MIIEQLKTFEQNLPKKPYCTDQLQYGLQIRSKNIAVIRRYIQHNKPTSVKYLAFDIDYAGVTEHIRNNCLPPPNLIAYNRKSGRSHVFYCLGVEVYTVQNARRKPLELLAVIEQQLCQELEADQGYSGLICKNPLHEAWDVQEIRQQPWDLAEFLEYLEIPPKRARTKAVYGLGRNVFLFDNTRFWAYAQVLSYRLSGAKEEFFSAVLNYAIQKNQQFLTPLSFSEVQATAKSIAKWTWNKYTGRMTDDEFSLIQAKRGSKSGTARLHKTLEQRVMANLYALIGLKQKEICALLSAPKQSVSRWLTE